jgi:hypothetical protein
LATCSPRDSAARCGFTTSWRYTTGRWGMTSTDHWSASVGAERRGALPLLR